ncbi:MAG TPA: DUF2867 domain-containing protein [Solirubrobacterales bacterium]
MTYGLRESGRVPNSEHKSQPWRIHELVPDFRLEDVWALPVGGGAGDFDQLLQLARHLDPAEGDSRASRFLWELRDRLGRWLGLGRVSLRSGERPAEDLRIPGTRETSLGERLPEDLRGSAAGMELGGWPFEPLYRTEREAAAEISNRTVHGVAHFAWVDRGGGLYQGQMAVYVKPRGRLGEGYMALIKPFRYLVVYPALMRQLGRVWEGRAPVGS